MRGESQGRLLSAVRACLQPLARILIRSGVTFRQFSVMSKAAFVEAAIAERDPRGRRMNVSRVAVRTGLSRKEVAKVLEQLYRNSSASGAHEPQQFHSSQAARVLQLWHSDARFVASDGRPKDLTFDESINSFSSLVRLVGGDVPPGAVRAELMAATALEETTSGLLRALKRHYVPADIGEELLVGLTHIVYPTIAGLVHNIDRPGSDAYVQRLAYTDRLIPAAIPLFRQVARNRAMELVQSVDDWLSSNESTIDEPTGEGRYVAVGVFYFEGALPALNSLSDHLPGG